MATSAERMAAAEALVRLARELEAGVDYSTLTTYVTRAKGDGYYLRVVLPDDVFTPGVHLSKGRTDLD